MLPENRLEHRWYFAAANHVRLMNASRCCIHTSARWSCWYKWCKHGTRRSERCWMCLNSWEETVDPAKHHCRPSSAHQFPTKTTNSCKCSLQSYELWKVPDYRHISSEFMQSKVGWVVPLTLYLVCHRQSTKGFTSQLSFQQIKTAILHPSWMSRYAIRMLQFEFECCYIECCCCCYILEAQSSSDDTCSHGDVITSDHFS